MLLRPIRMHTAGRLLISDALGQDRGRSPAGLAPTSALLHGVVAFAGALAFGAVISVPAVPIAWRSPLLAVALHTLAAAVGLAVLQLGAVRFLALGSLLDLSMGLAFGALAASNLVKLALLLMGTEPAMFLSTTFLLLARALSAGLLVLGVFRSPRVILHAQRTRYGVGFAAAIASGIGLGVALLALLGGASIPLLDAQTQAMLERGDAIQDVLPGQSPSLLLVSALTALGVAAAAVRSSWLSRRLADPQVGWLAIALILFAFGFALELPFPPVALAYVGFGDLFRMAAYIVLLVSLAISVGEASAERALGEERLRLSRDLHDGLAQQLSLMHFHLAEAIEQGRPMGVSGLERLEEQVERALLEARQAIGSLRAGTVGWEAFVSSVEAYCEEFEQNHGLAVRLKQEGHGILDVALESEILRILSEAFSNALRHGRATQATVRISSTVDCLELIVEDNGVGLRFEKSPLEPGSGVGLASMRERVERRGGALSVNTGPAGGTVLSARIPIVQAGAS